MNDERSGKVPAVACVRRACESGGDGTSLPCRSRRAASSWPLVACSRRACDADVGREEVRAADVTQREGRAGVVSGGGSFCGGRACAGEAKQGHKGVAPMTWPVWSWWCREAFGVGLPGWGEEKGRAPPNSTLVRGADSAARTNVEIRLNSSPEFHQLDEIWRNPG